MKMMILTPGSWLPVESSFQQTAPLSNLTQLYKLLAEQAKGSTEQQAPMSTAQICQPWKCWNSPNLQGWRKISHPNAVQFWLGMAGA